MTAGAPRLHDEPEYVNFADSDPQRNLAAQIHIDIGDVEQGLREADQVYRRRVRGPQGPAGVDRAARRR